MERPFIRAHAVIDNTETIDGIEVYTVTCWGVEPYNYNRTYQIGAESDNLAAQEGLRRFVTEMESLDLPED